MNRKLTIVVCAVMMLSMLTGCQLALENAGENTPAQDKLAGVFVTTEYIDLFDFESYIEDNLNINGSFGNYSGDDIVVEGDTKNYEGRLYATLKEIEPAQGDTPAYEQYDFEGAEGYSLLYITVPRAGERDSHNFTMSDPAVSNPSIAVNSSNEGETTTIEGTIRFIPTDEETIFHFNPVYQSPDGSVYLTASRMSMVAGPFGSSSILSDTYTVTENEKSYTKDITIKVNLEFMFAPENIVILQMGSDSQVLSREEYTPGKLPENFEPLENTEYLIVETHGRDYEGEQTITREVFGKDEESFATYFANTDKVCTSQSTNIVW